MRRRRSTVIRAAVLALCALAIALGSSMWRPAAQRAVPGTPAVRILGASERVAVPPGEKGATYYWLEEQATRTVTRFGDAAVAIAERRTGGEVHTRLTDIGGAEIATLHVTPIDRGTTVLNYRAADGESLRVAAEPRVRHTLDWASRQAYILYMNKAGRGTAKLEWKDGFVRPSGAASRDIERDVAAVQTDWARGLSARVTRKPVPRGMVLNGRPVAGDVVTTHLTLDGVEVGLSSWYPSVKVLAWDLPGLTAGAIAPEHLQAQYGGWPFTPDMTWMNLQTIAFHHFKTEINRNGFVARAERPMSLWEWLVPTLHANEPGCDGFHWLDGTILRFCCDIHDACYSRSGCSSSTWWQWWSSWSCTACNVGAIGCIADGGLDYPMHPTP